MSRALFGIGFIGFIAALGACPPAADHNAAPCSKIGQTCKLGPGLLGVCSESSDNRCERPPCLACVSQH
jgi:hypothetical protein